MHEGPERFHIPCGGSDLLMADVNFNFSSGVFSNSIIQKGYHPATKEPLSDRQHQLTCIKAQ